MKATEQNVRAIAKAHAKQLRKQIDLPFPSPGQYAISAGFLNILRRKMIEVERYHGIVVKVGNIPTKTLNLPDWDLSYVQYPPGKMAEYRDALIKAKVRVEHVTDMRIYFRQF